MKTVRFSEVVKRFGAPETHLVLIEPRKDKELQTAIKAHRVMTVFQQSKETKTDFGSVGFEEGSSRQYLVFPKSLRAVAGRKVVGVKYDLLTSEEIPKSQRAKPPKPPTKRKPKPSRVRTKSSDSAPSKVIEFHPSSEDDSDEGEDLREIKRLAREAMRALEQGKQVAAFNLLKRIAAS